MENKKVNPEVINAEISASTGTQNKESMKKGTFTLPTLQEAQNYLSSSTQERTTSLVLGLKASKWQASDMN